MAAVTSFVVDENDLESLRGDGDTASVRIAFDAANGCELLEQRVIRFGPGRSAERKLAGQQEVLFIVDGRGRLDLDGRVHELEPNMGVYLTPGETYAVENPGPEELHVLSVLAPEDRVEGGGARKVTVRLDDQPELEASSERSFRYLVNEDAGCLDVTQFMGIVQPSKAPFHSHTYDEVGYVVAGEGFAHVGGSSFPLRAGSCFHLPPDEVHCIENNGSTEMRILGVFHPSGSPASRSYEDNNEGRKSSNGQGNKLKRRKLDEE
ncbi:MAG: cupin domain-containing protein [Actinomycetota bacterium]|nr:cupin domain-containing protein [Actinomycetota bacterium]